MMSDVAWLFMWMSIINGGLLILWTILWMLIPDLVYKTQAKFFPIERDTFNKLFYGFIGLFKILFLFFNLIPFIALLIIG